MSLGQTAILNDSTDREGEFRLGKPLVGIRKCQVRKDVLGPDGYSVFWCLCHFSWCPFANCSLALIRSRSCFGVAIPDLDFFWKQCRTYTAPANFTVYTARYVSPS